MKSKGSVYLAIRCKSTSNYYDYIELLVVCSPVIPTVSGGKAISCRFVFYLSLFAGDKKCVPDAFVGARIFYLSYVLKRSFEPFDEVVGLLFRKRERRKQAQDVGRGAAREAVLVIYKVRAELLMRHVETDAYHQSAAAYVGDAILMLL